MKASSFKVTLPESIESLSADLKGLFTWMTMAFRTLDLVENFQARMVTINFSGSGDVKIPNPFRDGSIPSRWIVADVQYSASTFTPQRGSVKWDGDYLYLRNSSGGTITATVLFFR